MGAASPAGRRGEPVFPACGGTLVSSRFKAPVLEECNRAAKRGFKGRRMVA